MFEVNIFFFNFSQEKIKIFQKFFSNRNYLAQYIPHTNLLLIISVNNPTCNCQKKKLSIEPNEIKYNDEQQCQLLKQEKYRRRPSGCHNYHPQVCHVFKS